MDSRIILALILLAPLFGCGGGNSGAIEASGTIEGTDVRIASQVMGQVLEVLVEEGSQVTRGDTLVIVDPTENRPAAQPGPGHDADAAVCLSAGSRRISAGRYHPSGSCCPDGYRRLQADAGTPCHTDDNAETVR